MSFLDERDFEYVETPFLNYEYVTQAVTGKIPDTTSDIKDNDYKRLEVENVLKLEAHNALSQIYAVFGKI